MSNFDLMQDKIKKPIKDEPTVADLKLEIEKIKKILNNLIELIKTRNF